MEFKRIIFCVVALFYCLTSFAQGEILIRFKSETNGKYGFENGMGEVIIEPLYDWCEPFAEGIAAVRNTNYKYGGINEKGEMVIPQIYEYDFEFSGGMARAAKKKLFGVKFGYIGVDGRALIPLKYAYATDFKGNLAFVEKTSKYGLIDRKGNVVIDFLYDDVKWMIGDGLIAVKKGSKWGFIDEKGFIVIDFIYDDVGDCFADGLAPVKMNSKWGYINKRGEIVIDCVYRYAHVFHEGEAIVSKNWESQGVINKKGEVVIDFGWKDIDFVGDNILLYSGFESRLVSRKGTVIKDFGKTRIYWNSFTLDYNDYHLYCQYLVGNNGRYYSVQDGHEFELKGTSIRSWMTADGLYKLERYADALHRFMSMAEDGNVEGMWYCGHMYEEGLGIQRDVPKAIEWYKRASAYGHKKSIDRLSELEFDDIQVLERQKPIVKWPNILSTTAEPQFVLKAEIKSASKIEYCKVYLNGMEVQEDNATGGSSVVKDMKSNENHDITINRTLVLREGKNTIKIKVKNAAGETVEEKTIEYKPDKVASEKAIIVWNDFPANTTESQLELDATVKSTVKDVVCRVLLNGDEIAAPTKGSLIVEDSKEIEYKYKLSVARTIVLQEGNNGGNTVTIEVRNAKGGLVATNQKHVAYRKPTLAMIEWDGVPLTTEEKQITLRAQIISDSPIEYYSILKDDEVVKKVEMNTSAVSRGSRIVVDTKKGEGGNTVSLKEPFALTEGDNSFVIEVKNAAGIVQTMPKVVRYKHKEKRIALVIGNAKYEKNQFFLSLRNPVNDATALANKLKGFGFTVLHVHNGTREMMNKEIDAFIREAVTSDMALFYYSGHGMQIKSKGNDNFMIPVVPPQYVEDIEDACISANDIVDRLQAVNCQAGIIVLDACRVEPNLPSKDNPNAPKGTGGVKGLSSMSPQGFITVFAAADNCEAYDGIGNNSPFMESMLECFDNYSQLPIESFFKKVRELTYEKSQQRQWPYVYEGLRGDFYFRNNSEK